jgi:hypothetical protein
VAEEITKKEGEKLATRNPVPNATREIQNLEVDKGVPPAPEPQKPDEIAKAKEELVAMEAKLEGYKRGNQAKDKAIEDLKKAAEEATKPVESEDTADIQGLIDAAVRKQVAAADEARDARSAPFRASVEELTREKAEQAAVAEVGADAVEKFRDAAEEQLKLTPNLTRAQAYKLVVPAGIEDAVKIGAASLMPHGGEGG